ncbi:MAG: hypothetical protein WB507_04445 [Solirubrobacterales bacterium]
MSSVSGTSVRRAASHRASRHVAVDLTPQAVEQVAARLAQLLLRGERAQPELLSAGELARRLRVERPWVYRHRELLGGMRIGSGPKAPWRFDYEIAVEAMKGQPRGRQRRGEI